MFVAANGTVSTRVEAGAGLSQFGGVQINDLGTVAFAATRTAGGSGIYRVDAAGTLTAAAETGDTYSYFGDPNFGPFEPALNNTEQVAFLAGLTAGGKGIFTGSDLLADKVIRTGDLLDGSTVTDLGFGRYGLNDSGQVTFWAALADGRSGVYTLTPVPEPAGLLAAAAALVAWRRLRRPAGVC